jgi:hypothetical protein
MTKLILTEEEIQQAAEFSDADSVSKSENEYSENDDDNDDEDDNISENSDIGDIIDCNEDEETTEKESDTHQVTKDNTIWLCNQQLFGKIPSHNIIKGSLDKVMLPPGKIIEAPIDSFRLYINENICGNIVLYTNEEADRVYREKNIKKSWKPVDIIEMYAFFALLLAAGHMKSSAVSIKRLWNKMYGPMMFRATMSEVRFKQILRFIRFDERETRSVRRLKDKFAPLRSIWESVNNNLKKHFMPGTSVTVDEQLVGYKGRCPFKQYIPSKPDKYGMKIFWINDSSTGYPLGGLPYLGKENGIRALPNLGERIVEQLCAPYFGTHRNVTCDNFFTTLQLALTLKSNGLTMVGTLRKNKAYIPRNFLPNRSRPEFSSLFGFTKYLTMVSYVPQKGKAVLLLSSMHHEINTNSDKKNKPEIVLYYNSTKGGTDLMDQMAHTYTCKRKTNRWPFSFFMNLLDISGIAAYILYIKIYPNWNIKNFDRRNAFLEELAEDLARPHILRRIENGKNRLRKGVSQLQETGPPKKITKRSQCHLCLSKRQIYQSCCVCKNNICKQHSKIICNNCSTDK